MKSIAMFQSDTFSLKPHVNERGVSSDLPLGNDMAAFLKMQLASVFPFLQIDDPILEDWGAILLIKDGDATYDISINWTPIAHHLDNNWAIQFDKPIGCLAALFGRKSSPEDSNPMIERVRQILEANPNMFKNVVWLSDAEFRRVCQEKSPRPRAEP